MSYGTPVSVFIGDTPGEKAFYSTPFHCVTVHLADMYGLVNLRSVVAETAERRFGRIRWGAKSIDVKNLIHSA